MTRKEMYLRAIAEGRANVPKPVTREEMYLYKIAQSGGGGSLTPEQIEEAVENYLVEHPVSGGSLTPDEIGEAVAVYMENVPVSAYQIAVENGFVGTEEEWLESLKGVSVEEETIRKMIADIIAESGGSGSGSGGDSGGDGWETIVDRRMTNNDFCKTSSYPCLATVSYDFVELEIDVGIPVNTSSAFVYLVNQIYLGDDYIGSAVVCANNLKSGTIFIHTLVKRLDDYLGQLRYFCTVDTQGSNSTSWVNTISVPDDGLLRLYISRGGDANVQNYLLERLRVRVKR